MANKTATIDAKKTQTKNPDASAPWPRAAPIQPILRVDDVQKASGFYQRLGFTQTMAVPASDGSWAWAVLQFGSGAVQLMPVEGEGVPNTKRERNVRKGPRGLGVSLYCNVPKVDPVLKACKEAGLEITNDPHETYSGDRVFSCIDAFGYEWTFGETVKGRNPEQVAQANPR